MKTLYHVQEQDLVWEATLLNKEILDETTLVLPLKAAVANKLKLSKKNPRSSSKISGSISNTSGIYKGVNFIFK